MAAVAKTLGQALTDTLQQVGSGLTEANNLGMTILQDAHVVKIKNAAFGLFAEFNRYAATASFIKSMGEAAVDGRWVEHLFGFADGTVEGNSAENFLNGFFVANSIPVPEAKIAANVLGTLISDIVENFIVGHFDLTGLTINDYAVRIDLGINQALGSFGTTSIGQDFLKFAHLISALKPADDAFISLASEPSTTLLQWASDIGNAIKGGFDSQSTPRPITADTVLNVSAAAVAELQAQNADLLINPEQVDDVHLDLTNGDIEIDHADNATGAIDGVQTLTPDAAGNLDFSTFTGNGATQTGNTVETPSPTVGVDFEGVSPLASSLAQLTLIKPNSTFSYSDDKVSYTFDAGPSDLTVGFTGPGIPIGSLPSNPNGEHTNPPSQFATFTGFSINGVASPTNRVTTLTPQRNSDGSMSPKSYTVDFTGWVGPDGVTAPGTAELKITVPVAGVTAFVSLTGFAITDNSTSPAKMSDTNPPFGGGAGTTPPVVPVPPPVTPPPVTPPPVTPPTTPTQTITTAGPIGGTTGNTINVTASNIGVTINSNNTSPIFIHGTNDSVMFGQATANFTLTDDGQGTKFTIPFFNPKNITISINDFQKDPTGVFTLVDQFPTAAAAVVALKSDGHGGEILPLNGGALNLDFIGDTALAAANFKVGNL